jgi:hypothetical protein
LYYLEKNNCGYFLTHPRIIDSGIDVIREETTKGTTWEEGRVRDNKQMVFINEISNTGTLITDMGPLGPKPRRRPLRMTERDKRSLDAGYNVIRGRWGIFKLEERPAEFDLRKGVNDRE